MMVEHGIWKAMFYAFNHTKHSLCVYEHARGILVENVRTINNLKCWHKKNRTVVGSGGRKNAHKYFCMHDSMCVYVKEAI
jgi:hypothetical protein